MKITFEILELIYSAYNPLGDRHNFLVDDFLEWCKDVGDFYWVWGGALEYSESKDDPKTIIKELPFIKVNCTYRELLIDAWLRFLNDNESRQENIMREYDVIANLPF